MSYLDNFLYNYNNQHQYEYRYDDNITTNHNDYDNNDNNSNTVDYEAAEANGNINNIGSAMKKALEKENEKIRKQLQQQKQRNEKTEEEVRRLRQELNQLKEAEQKQRKEEEQYDDDDDGTDDQDSEGEDDDDETENEDDDEEEEPENIKYDGKKSGNIGQCNSSKNTMEVFQRDYQLLVEFKNEFGHLNLSLAPAQVRPEKYKRIRRIMRRERKFYKRWEEQKDSNDNNNKVPERIRMLEELGFEYKTAIAYDAICDAIWDENFVKLQKLRAKYGHCCIPAIIEIYKDDDIACTIPKYWIWKQRSIMKEVLKHRYVQKNENVLADKVSERESSMDVDEDLNREKVKVLHRGNDNIPHGIATVLAKHKATVAGQELLFYDVQFDETGKKALHIDGSFVEPIPPDVSKPTPPDVSDATTLNESTITSNNNKEANDKNNTDKKIKKKKKERIPSYWSDIKRDQLLSLKCSWWSVFESTSKDIVNTENGFPPCNTLNSFFWYRSLELFRDYVKRYGSGLNADLHFNSNMKTWVRQQWRLYEFISKIKEDSNADKEIKLLCSCEEFDWNKEMLTNTDFVFDRTIVREKLQEEKARKVTIEIERLQKEEKEQSSAFKLENAKREKQQAIDAVHDLKEQMKTLQDQIKEAQAAVRVANEAVREAHMAADKVYVKARGGNDVPHGIATVITKRTVTVVGQQLSFYDVQFDDTGEKAFHIDGIFVEQYVPAPSPVLPKKPLIFDRPKTRSSSRKRKSTSIESFLCTEQLEPSHPIIDEKSNHSSASSTSPIDNNKDKSGKSSSMMSSSYESKSDVVQAEVQNVNEGIQETKMVVEKDPIGEKVFVKPRGGNNKQHGMATILAVSRVTIVGQHLIFYDVQFDESGEKELHIDGVFVETAIEQQTTTSKRSHLTGKNTHEKPISTATPSEARDDKAKELIESTILAYKKWKEGKRCLSAHDLLALLQYTQNKHINPPDPPVSIYNTVDEMRVEWDVRKTRKATIADLEQLLLEDNKRDGMDGNLTCNEKTETLTAVDGYQIGEVVFVKSILDGKYIPPARATILAKHKVLMDGQQHLFYDIRFHETGKKSLQIDAMFLERIHDIPINVPDKRMKFNAAAAISPTKPNLSTNLIDNNEKYEHAMKAYLQTRSVADEDEGPVGDIVFVKPRGGYSMYGMATILAIHEVTRGGQQLIFYDVRFHQTGRQEIHVDSRFVESIDSLPCFPFFTTPTLPPAALPPPTPPTPFLKNPIVAQATTEKMKEVAIASTKPNTCKEQQATGAPSEIEKQLVSEKSKNTSAPSAIQNDNECTVAIPSIGKLNNNSVENPNNNNNNLKLVCEDESSRILSKHAEKSQDSPLIIDNDNLDLIP